MTKLYRKAVMSTIHQTTNKQSTQEHYTSSIQMAQTEFDLAITITATMKDNHIAYGQK
jgi:hypothetical protein